MTEGVSKYPIVGGLVALLVIVLGGVGFFWSDEPELFDVRARALQETAEQGNNQVVGYVTVNTLVEVANVLLDKPGGYLSNDIFPPGLLLDNIPNWEFGVLVQVRDLSQALRKDIARSQSQSREDLNLAIAEPQFNFDHKSWAFPATENEYRRGVKELNKYLARLSDVDSPDAQFYARADNLRSWLSDVSKRLGSLSQRLSSSVGQRVVNIDLAGDSAAAQSTFVGSEMSYKTPWLEIDDVFYEARGTTWALYHFLKAVEVDFNSVLEKKNAVASLQQIIREMEATQQTVWSPLILNGDGMGVLANHSLVMANYISRANAAIIDFRELLSKG
ncbi:MAG: DUF2333 family protein [Pseudomonadales bacterium]|nr:DUF2333 family protein [Pseudomonadales bacterium]